MRRPTRYCIRSRCAMQIGYKLNILIYTKQILNTFGHNIAQRESHGEDDIAKMRFWPLMNRLKLAILVCSDTPPPFSLSLSFFTHRIK